MKRYSEGAPAPDIGETLTDNIMKLLDIMKPLNSRGPLALPTAEVFTCHLILPVL